MRWYSWLKSLSIANVRQRICPFITIGACQWVIFLHCEEGHIWLYEYVCIYSRILAVPLQSRMNLPITDMPTYYQDECGTTRSTGSSTGNRGRSGRRGGQARVLLESSRNSQDRMSRLCRRDGIESSRIQIPAIVLSFLAVGLPQNRTQICFMPFSASVFHGFIMLWMIDVASAR
jgi:hypothetical protein